TPSEVEWQDARLDTYRCRDAKSGAARETRAGAKRGCLKQLCATTILKNAAWQEITEKLEWAMVYLSKNGKKSRQRKSKQNNTLDGIINSLAA
ncbi:hypothetical protein P0C28_24045, partial (plasmid) [Aeromonas hydrophila]|nr:hypothetical protein [Aeromonas hydrophila]